MKRFKYNALLTLYPPDHGGLANDLPCQTRCLVVKGRHHDSHASKIFSSVVATADDRPLHPGDRSVPVMMQLNGDDAREYFGPGDRFTLWFGNDVGQGVVCRETFT